MHKLYLERQTHKKYDGSERFVGYKLVVTTDIFSKPHGILCENIGLHIIRNKLMRGISTANYYLDSSANRLHHEVYSFFGTTAVVSRLNTGSLLKEEDYIKLEIYSRYKPSIQSAAKKLGLPLEELVQTA